MPSFVQTGFLLGGLAVAIPVLIHLLLKQRARRVEIGSVRFLQQVLKEHNRMRRIREWLLLAARIGTVLLLALLFARPYFDQSAVEAARREIIFLLDRSASMQFETGGESLLEKAYQMLRAEIRQTHEQTAVRVATFDSESVSELDWEHDDSPEPSFAATDYGLALGWARDALQSSNRLKKEIVLFSDLQQSGLGHTPLIDFPPHLEVKIRDLGEAISRNLAIVRAEATAVEIRPKMPPRVEVDLKNGSPIPADKLSVSLNLKDDLGNTVELKKIVSIEGQSVATVEFEIPSAIESTYVGKASVQYADELEFDNQRYLAFEARKPDRILMVDGEEASSLYGDETYYLQAALQVGKENAEMDVPTYEVERIVWDNGKGFPSLDGFRAIVIANVGSFSDADADRLISYLSDGGCVLFFCGDRFSRRAAKPLVDAGLLQGTIEGTGNLGPYRISEWDQEHPIFQPFKDPQYGDLRSLRFQKLSLLGEPDQYGKPQRETKAEANAKHKVLARASTGDPLLLEWQVSNTKKPGKVLLWTSSVDAEWTNWPQSRLYVPVVRQMLAYATDHHLRKKKTVEAVATKKIGIQQEQDRVVVLNGDPLESELARVSPAEFRSAFNLPEIKALEDLTPTELAALAPPDGSLRPEELWRWVAWALLGWLILETFLAGQVHA